MSDSKSQDAGVWPFVRIPETWIWAQFADLFANVTSSDRKLPQKEYDTSGLFPVVDQGQEPVGGYTSRSELLFTGCLPVVIFGDHTRCLKFIEHDFVQGADGVKVLRTEPVLEPRFGFWALRATRLPDRGYSRHFKFLRATEFPVPPVLEQRRIVARIEALEAHGEAVREALDAIPPLLERFRQSVLASALRGDLTRVWRAHNPDVEPASVLLERMRTRHKAHKVRRGVPESVKRSRLVEERWIPSTWSLVSIASLLRSAAIIDLKDGNHGANHPLKNEFTEDGLPFITAAQVRDGRIDYRGARKVSGVALQRLRVGFARPGDVIFTHKGTVGRVAICERDCVLTPQTTYYRVSEHCIDRRFLSLQLQSPWFRSQYREVKSQTTRDHLTIARQYRLFLLIPPLEEQRVIADRVTARLTRLADTRKIFDAMESSLNSMTQSILAKAFRGELVPQDPNDEPASVLLERIRAERAQADAARKASKKKRRRKPR